MEYIVRMQERTLDTEETTRCGCISSVYLLVISKQKSWFVSAVPSNSSACRSATEFKLMSLPFSPKLKSCQQLALSWGIHPMLSPDANNTSGNGRYFWGNYSQMRCRKPWRSVMLSPPVFLWKIRHNECYQVESWNSLFENIILDSTVTFGDIFGVLQSNHILCFRFCQKCTIGYWNAFAGFHRTFWKICTRKNDWPLFKSRMDYGVYLFNFIICHGITSNGHTITVNHQCASRSPIRTIKKHWGT